MPAYDLPFFALSNVSTDDPDGFADPEGDKFTLGVNTLTISPQAASQTLSVTDWRDDTFDDDAGGGQSLNGAQTIDGVTYKSGTNIESEYVLVVEDANGGRYTRQFVSMNKSDTDITGFVVQGPTPPGGQALTIVDRDDMKNGAHKYSTATGGRPPSASRPGR